MAALKLGAIRYFDRIGSTNDEAANWAEQGAPELALVAADEQTAGRGRSGRAWYSPAGASLSFSMVLYPPEKEAPLLGRFNALGALAVSDALRELYGLQALIKWPNDVLVDRRKVSGVLAEASWTGGELAALILGIGINVAPESVNEGALQKSKLLFPATYVEAHSGRPVDRIQLLYATVEKLLYWRPRLPSAEFLKEWEARLAFKGEWVQVTSSESPAKDRPPGSLDGPPLIEEGEIIGLGPDGSLVLRSPSGIPVPVRIGEVRLRPAE